MKKSKIGLSAALLVAVFSLNFVTADAAKHITKTDGEVEFDTDTANTIIKPGSPEDEVIGLGTGAANTQGAARIEYVPKFSFGKPVVSPVAKEYPALYSTYVEKPAGTAPTTEFIPNFVQVTDARGTGTGYWTLSVEQDAVFTNTGGNTLPKTRIYIHEQHLINNIQKEADLAGVADLATNPQPIGLNGGQNESALVVLQNVKTKDSVDTSTSSNVFMDKAKYNVADYGSASTLTPKLTATSTHDGVKLHVPAGDLPKVNDKYTAKLTWTLEDAP